MPLPDALTEARRRSGLSQEDVAAALGVSRAMISYWESGRRSPSDRQLTSLANLYRVDPSDLVNGHLQDDADLAEMLFRGAPTGIPSRARLGLRDFVAFLQTYATLADEVGFELHGMKQSPFTVRPGFDSADDARRKAEEVRATLRLGVGGIGDLDWVCELLGITTYRAALGEDLQQTISGAFFAHPDVGFSILVNVEMTPGRRRFTVAHELAHALFHSDGDTPYVLSYSKKDRRERFADAFAGELLMPTEGIRRVMEEHGISRRIDDPSDVIHLQRFFNVSYYTALVRLRQSRILSNEKYREFRRVRPVILARALGYDIDDEEVQQDPDRWRISRYPRRFLRLLRIAVTSGTVSVQTAANIADITIDEVAELLSSGLEDKDLGEEKVSRELQEFEDSGIPG